MERRIDKLLILGNNYLVDVFIRLAKTRGIYTVVTDNLSVDNSPEKKMADAYWDISVTDIDELEKKCIENKINAVVCGASEICMEANRKLCKKLGLPFYVSDKAWEIANNKVLFKEKCKKYGIPVPKDFHLSIEFNPEDLKKIEYPVVVKPADGCSSIGLHVCFSEEELMEGYRDSYNKSPIHQVVVEKYYAGEDVSILLFFSNGKMKIIESGDAYGEKRKGYPFLWGSAPSKYVPIIEKKILKSAKKMFNDLECQEGVISLQFIVEKDDIAVLEMNYRLPGGKIYNQEYICNQVLDFVLKGKTTDSTELLKVKPTLGYVIWLKKGVISEISGLDIIRDKLKPIYSEPMKKIGDIVDDSPGMRKIFMILTVEGNNLEKMAEVIKVVNKYLIVKDENGKDMLYRYNFYINEFNVDW